MSITDSPTQQVFAVTMRNLQEGDSGYYWCGVEIRGGADDGAYLGLTVTKGSPGLSVLNNTVVGEEGGSVSIQCLYSNSLSEETGEEGHRLVLVHCRRGAVSCSYHCHAKTSNTETHHNITTENKTDFSHSTVEKLQVTLSTPDKENDPNAKSLSAQLPLLVTLGLLLLLAVPVAVVMVTWGLQNKHREMQAKCLDTDQTSTDLTQPSDPESDVMYTTVIPKRRASRHKISVDPEVTYSCIALQHRETLQPSVDPGCEVTYSSIVLQHRDGR
ncbi:hypothetical protein MATL_G00032740 [Megalops atlanticus]|uniref:Immunoglobulin subtype domain-containing protein n=1 Tax=Megalops atlanticus TaxID=7932 RepID=A0A9D3TGG8_MEGAT|nr:hypothetical protein MATL_G00032740 [Megalops atlanticus]